MDVYPKKNLLYSFELNQVLMEGAEVPKDQQNTEFPKDSEGRVYHITAKKGEGIYFFKFINLLLF